MLCKPWVCLTPKHMQVLACATEAGYCQLHYHTGSRMGELPAGSQSLGPVNSIAFSKGSKLLTLGCSDAQLHVWDLKLQAREPVLTCAGYAKCGAWVSPRK